ncbi:hypothetical protein [Lactococcus lactis]|uniref:Phage protein n=1 Tax=Lactococcus lactis TaxID=1358 RepID=A0AB35KHF5_9LACT|nr:hypothetical protein [Lactococcus lactis]MDG5049939.1 hypothetical protein [Lactococcus lactis]
MKNLTVAQQIADEVLEKVEKNFDNEHIPDEDRTLIEWRWQDEALTKISQLPRLTIPKSVADVLDKRWEAQNEYLQRKVAVPRDAFYNVVNPYDNQLAATKIGEWIDENQSICFAYLSGKALKVDLVQVVKA